MNKLSVAIILAINPKANFSFGKKDLGILLAHADHIEKEGAVMYDIVTAGEYITDKFPFPEITKCYFYEVGKKAVTHLCDIDYIKAGKELKQKREDKFLPEWRKHLWNNRKNDFYWMKLDAIHELKKNYPLSCFNKISDNKPIRRLQNYSFIKDPKLTYYSKKITRQSFINDFIGKLLIAGSVTEKDIETIFSHRLAIGSIFIGSELSFKQSGRLDLLFKNQHGNYVVYELKKGNAGISALGQIKKYMGAVSKKHDISKNKIKGIILAQSISPDLTHAVRNESNISTKKYYFSIDLK